MKSGEGVWSSATLSPLFRLSPLCFFEKCFADHDILGATPALFLVGFSIGAWEAPGFAEVASWVRRLLAAVRPPSAARMRSITGGVPPRAPQAADPRSPPRHAPPPGPHPVHRTVPPEPLLDGMGALRFLIQCQQQGLECLSGGLGAVVAGLGMETSRAGIGCHGEIAVGLTQPGAQTARHGLRVGCSRIASRQMPRHQGSSPRCRSSQRPWPRAMTSSTRPVPSRASAS